TRFARFTGSGFALAAIVPRSWHAARKTSPTEPLLSSTRLSTGSARSMNRHIRSSARSARVWATRSTIIAFCRSRSLTKSRRCCQSTKDRADRKAVRRLLISVATVSSPACAASSSRRRRLISASPSASSTRIAARRSGPSATRLSRVMAFLDAMPSASPEPFEPPTGGLRVVDGVPGIAVPEVVLDEAQVVPLVSEREATGVPQRVRVGARQAGTLRCHRNQVIHSLPGERLITLGDEQPGQRIGARSKVSLDGAQFVTRDRLLDRQSALEAAHPQSGAVEVEFVPAQAHGLADPQSVAIGHEQKQVVAHAVTAGLGGVQQPDHFSGRQIVFAAFV